ATTIRSSCFRPDVHALVFCTDTATPEIYTLSLHDALPISMVPHAGTDSDIWRDVVALGADLRKLAGVRGARVTADVALVWDWERSEEHTSELQSRENLVCRLLLEKKNNKIRD